MTYKLSDLLKAEADLKAVNPERLEISIDNNIQQLVDIITRFNLANNGKAKRSLALIEKKISEANDTLAEIIALAAEFESSLTTERKKAHRELLKIVNDDPYNFTWNTDEDYLQHRSSWQVRSSVIDQVVGLLGKYVDWRFPVVYLDPNTGELTRYLVSGDPFYVVDDRTLPYKKILESLTEESENRILHYTRSAAQDYLEKNSASLVVSWKNFPFMKLRDIRQDIEFMSSLVLPGGYVVFDYVDAETIDGATAIENGLCSFQWRQRILEFLKDNHLSVIHELEFFDYPNKLIFCKKKGELPDLKINNKIGLVLPNEEVLAERRRQETELMLYYKAMTSSLKEDLRKNEERDQILNNIEKQRRVDTIKITENKLKTALSNLDSALEKYPDTHPIVLESILNVSKLTYSLGRKKDSINLIKRVMRNINQLNQDSKIVQDYRSWIQYLNNN